LEKEIEVGGKLPEYYRRLAKGLDYISVKRLAEVAIKKYNISALLGLAKTNRYAVVDALVNSNNLEILARKAAKNPEMGYAFFFLVRRNIPEKYRRLFLNFLKISILKSALGKHVNFSPGPFKRKVEYQPGLDDFDLDETLEKFLEQRYLTHSDVVGIEREERRKAGVLILDTSGSMYGEKIVAAALATATIAYHMRNVEYSIIGFNTKATIIKKITERKPTTRVVEEILETEAAGFTNIEDALKKALKELKKSKIKEKWAILMTDGLYNRGKDPRKLAYLFPKLHVIALPTQQPIGTKICEQMAKLGHGKFAQIKGIQQIPKVLVKILKRM